MCPVGPQGYRGHQACGDGRRPTGPCSLAKVQRLGKGIHGCVGPEPLLTLFSVI